MLSGGGRDIPLFKVFMPESVLEPLKHVLFSGYIGEGPVCKEFESLLARRFKNKNVLTLNNGTAALQLALRLAGVGHGDDVVSTAMTCTATNEPILALGANIVWADINPGTGNICPESVRKKITPRTKAIMCVHWGGYPCDLDELNQIAAEHGIKLVEDACHAFGATYKKKPIGSCSDFACFSFQAIKHMTTIDGGALTCRIKKDCDRGRLLRWYGIDRTQERKDFRCESDILEYGYKFHMNDVTAAIGVEQLKHVSDTLRKHRANAKAFNKAFKNFKRVHPLDYKSDRLSSYWLYTVRANDCIAFMRHMTESGVTVSQVHARNDTHTAFRQSRASLPGVDEFVKEQVSIPVGWWLSDEDVSRIIKAVTDFERL